MSTASGDELVMIPLGDGSAGNSCGLSHRLSRGSPTSFYVADATARWSRLWLDCDLIQPSFYPLVLFGPSGTGKTTLAQHLTRALAESRATAIDHRRGAKPILISAVDFARQVTAHEDTDSLPEVRRRFLSAAAVMIDDVHQLERYPAAQTMLGSLLDALSERLTPVILTSVLSPHSWGKVAESLRSRMAGGLSLSIAKPGPSARRWILERLLASEGFTITPAAKEYLVNHCPWNYPQLQHLVSRIALSRKSSFPGHRRPIGLSFIESFLQRHPQDATDRLLRLSKVVAKEYQVTVRALRGPSRKQSLVAARNVAIYLARRLLDVSFTEIGRFFGNRDHSTIIHACEKVASRLNQDDPTRLTIERLYSELEYLSATWDQSQVGNPGSATWAGIICS